MITAWVGVGLVLFAFLWELYALRARGDVDGDDEEVGGGEVSAGVGELARRVFDGPLLGLARAVVSGGGGVSPPRSGRSICRVEKLKVFGLRFPSWGPPNI